LHPSARYDVEHHKCKRDDDVITNKRSKTSHKKNRKELQEDAATKELINPCTHRTKNQNLSTSSRKHQQLRKQYKEVDDDVVDFISSTPTIPSIEGVNRMNVLTNSLEESGNGDVTTRLANIVSEEKCMGTFKVIRNQLGSTAKKCI